MVEGSVIQMNTFKIAAILLSSVFAQDQAGGAGDGGSSAPASGGSSMSASSSGSIPAHAAALSLAAMAILPAYL
ncbi:hypothetical protein L0F63_001798 [Massospora cicadina]|nr:hypothetical protein L0F63_001798 [Massospora cicadina]